MSALNPPQTAPRPASPARSQYVICLAGHIDHGKSSLVQALTGGAVDRLPEEKRRGITIELGFAHFDADGCRFALIDVPGHERFIHTMVAGASGVDAALLVIAADDSVMPQTREHLALLELLGVRRAVVAISKCDLADDEQLEMVELEVAELLETTSLADALRLRVSTHTGQGVPELKAALMAAAKSAPARAAQDTRFRLPIDRAFSPAGQGAVVTGTVWRGTASVGDKLHLLPKATPVRIRRLQSQGRDVEHVTAGERAAINLVGIKASEIERGHELATPDAFIPSRRHLVALKVLYDAPVPLKHRQFVRVHLGASQATAQVVMEQKEVAPGQAAFAILRCKSPIVAEYGQPFVIRQLSPATTLGGGTMIGPSLLPGDRLVRCLAAAPGLNSAIPLERVLACVALRREASFDDSVESWIGLPQDRTEKVLQELVRQHQLVRVSGPPVCYVTVERFVELKQQFSRACQRELERRRPASQVPLSVVLSAMSRHASPHVLDAVLEDMVARRELVRRGDRIGLPSGAELSHKQRQLLETFLSAINAAKGTPPSLREFADQQGYALKDVEAIVQVALDDGSVVKLTPTLMISREALETLRQSLSTWFRSHPTATVSELREYWGMTRKHAVPISEFFDQAQVTLRNGDLRSAGPRLELPLNDVS